MRTTLTGSFYIGGAVMSSRLDSPADCSVSSYTNEFQAVDNDAESPSIRSVKTVVASFETQQRNLDVTSPKLNIVHPYGSTSKKNVDRLRAEHLRSASDDFSRGNLLHRQDVLSAVGNTGEVSTSPNVVGRSIADLRAVLQNDEDYINSVEKRAPCRRTRGIDVRRSHEININLKPSEMRNTTEHSVANTDDRIYFVDGSQSDSSLVENVDSDSLVVRSNGTTNNALRQDSGKKSRPPVLPKPRVKRLPNGDVEVVKPVQNESFSSCDAAEYDVQIVAERTEVHSLSDCSITYEGESVEKSCDNLENYQLNLSDVSCMELPTSCLTLSEDALKHGIKSVSALDNSHTGSTSGSRCDVQTRRRPSREPYSGDSSRTSSNLSVFGSSNNVDSIVDDELCGSNSFYLSQTDSGINIHDTSVVEEISSLSGEAHFHQVSAILMASYGRSSFHLSQVICEWSAYRTALDYIGELYVETDQIQRYHVQFLSYYCRVSDSEIQFLSLEALSEAVQEKIIQRRDELRRAKDAIETDMVNIKHLETQVSKTIKLKAADRRHFDKFHVYFDELDKVTQLLLLLSSRLSRVDNSINKLATSSDENQMVSLTSRRSEILQKLDDARLLKSDIDRRSEALTSSLVASLDVDECSDLARLFTERFRLTLQRQEIADWLRLSEEHIKMFSRNFDALSCTNNASCC